MKDECAYLVEWVAYYRLLGAGRIVLYSNDCSDGTDALLDAMQAADLVEHRPWPSVAGLPPQQSAYRDAIGRCATRWILFVDADEFLHLHDDRTLQHFAARFPDDVSAVAISWRLFGSHGRTDHGRAPVIERFTRAAPAGHMLNRHVKTMAVAADINVAGVHGVILRRGRYVMANGADIELHRHAFAEPDQRVAQINHYVVKSRAEFAAKQRRGIASLAPEKRDGPTPRDTAFFDIHDRNEEVETGILVRRDALRAEMVRVRRAIGRPTLIDRLKAWQWR